MRNKHIWALLLFAITSCVYGQQIEIEQPVRLLALGDSYTIGQSVPINERWPEQLADSLETYDYGVAEVDIIAVTGWTTGNLINALNTDDPDSNFTLVSLLIGVNNQFQGRDISEYSEQFEQLLLRAIAHAGGIKSHVFVLSIPDYAFTPFGGGNENVTQEIDEFNEVNEQITKSLGVTYINITDISRRGLEEPELVASDGLHPSGLMYAEWVERILDNAGIGPIVSTKRHAYKNVLELYPNPVNDRLYINLNSEYSYTIIDSAGRMVKRGKSSSQQPLDVSMLHDGHFTVTVENDGSWYSANFLKFE